MNRAGDDGGMEPITDHGEAVQPDRDLTMSQRYEKLIDELYQELDRSKENRDYLRERGEQDALLIAELKQLLREAVPMIEAAWEEHVSLSPTKHFNPWQGERWLDRARETLGDAHEGGKEE